MLNTSCHEAAPQACQDQVDLLQLKGSNFALETLYLLPIRLFGRHQTVDTLGREYCRALRGEH